MNNTKNTTRSGLTRYNQAMKLLISAALISGAAASGWDSNNSKHMEDPSLVFNDWVGTCFPSSSLITNMGGTPNTDSSPATHTQFGWFPATCKDFDGETDTTGFELRLPYTINVASFSDFIENYFRTSLLTLPTPKGINGLSFTNTESYSVDPSPYSSPPSLYTGSVTSLATNDGKYSIPISTRSLQIDDSSPSSGKPIAYTNLINQPSYKTGAAQTNTSTLRIRFSNGVVGTGQINKIVYYKIKVLPDTFYTPTFVAPEDRQVVTAGQSTFESFLSPTLREGDSYIYTVPHKSNDGCTVESPAFGFDSKYHADLYKYTPPTDPSFKEGFDSFQYQVSGAGQRSTGQVTLYVKPSTSSGGDACFNDDDAAETISVQSR
ncbi:MAG: hypothetical protein WCP46_05650 [Alphaproteobacteria bacterium]